MMTNVPDAETTMAVHRATGLPVMKAKEFIMTAAPELVRRILEGHRVRHFIHLSKLPSELVDKIIEASEDQSSETFLRDPIEDDPAVGKIIHEVLERTSLELEARYAKERPMGLCHLIWRTAQERLLHEHSLVWYSPAQMNPGCCFD